MTHGIGCSPAGLAFENMIHQAQRPCRLQEPLSLHGTEATPTLHQEEAWAAFLDEAADPALRPQMIPLGL